MQAKPKWPHRYRITYREGDETHEWTCRAGDADHAEEKFIDSVMESDGCFMGIRILSIKHIRERGVA